MHQFVKLSMVIIENAAYFGGGYVFTNMLGPQLDQLFNHYQMWFMMPTMIRGQKAYDSFTFDFRSTQSPFIGPGYIDFYLIGEVIQGYHGLHEVEGIEGQELNKFISKILDNGQGPCVLEADELVFSGEDQG